jgi:hypothetical protein
MSAFGERFVHPDRPTEPRMPRITDFSRLSILGVALSSCTIGTVHIGRYASLRRFLADRRSCERAAPRLMFTAAIVSTDCFMNTAWRLEPNFRTLQG